MPEEQKGVPFPLKGRNDALAYSSQPDGTTSEAVNVRGLDPQTGRLRGAQRSGTTEVHSAAVNGDTPPKPVRHLGVVGHHVDMVDYTARTEAQLDIEATGLGVAKSEAFSPRVDLGGNVYILDGDEICVFSSEMELRSTIRLPIGSRGGICRHIAVDGYGAVFAATQPFGVRNGMLHCYAREGNEHNYRLAWEYRLEGKAACMEHSNGMLLVGCHRSSIFAEPESFIAAISVASGVPSPVWTRRVPHPIRDVSGESLGGIISTSARNPQRFIGGPGGFGVTSVGWVPQHMEGFDERLHFWIDVETVDGPYHQDAIDEIPDTRLLPIWATNGFDPVHDDTDRPLYVKPDPEVPAYHAEEWGDIPGQGRTYGDRRGLKKNNPNGGHANLYPGDWITVGESSLIDDRIMFSLLGELWRSPPRFDVEGFGDKPGLRFDGSMGNVLGTFPNSSPKRKPDKEAKLPGSPSMVPACDSGPDYGDDWPTWSMWLVVRITPSSRPSMVFGHRGSRDGDSQLKFSIIANADTTFDPVGASGAPVGGSKGKILLRIGDTNIAALDYDTSNPTNSVIIGLTCNGEGAPVGFRVNGRGYNQVTYGVVTGKSTSTMTDTGQDFHDGVDDPAVNDIIHFTKASDARTNRATITSIPGSPIDNALVIDPGNAFGVGEEYRIWNAGTEVWGETSSFGASLQARSMIGSPQLFEGAFGLQYNWQPTANEGADGYRGGFENPTLSFNIGAQPEDPLGVGAVCDAMDGYFAEALTFFGPSNAGTDTSPNSIMILPSEEHKMEGYLAHKWGMQAILPSSHEYYSSPPVAVGGEPAAPGSLTSEVQLALRTNEAITCKQRISTGEMMWAYSGRGMGLAVEADNSGGFVVYGPRDTAALYTSPSPIIRKLNDDGSRVATGTYSAGTLTFNSNPSDGDTVRIGDDHPAHYYTFRNSVGTTSLEVQIGGDASTTRDNLVYAINKTSQSVASPVYGTSTTRNAFVSAEASSSNQIVVTALVAGSSQDALATVASNTSATSWGGGTLTGGDSEGTWYVAADGGDGLSEDPYDLFGQHDRKGLLACEVRYDSNGDVYVTRQRAAARSGIFKYAADEDGVGTGTADEVWEWLGSYQDSSGATVTTDGLTYHGLAFPPETPNYTESSGVTGQMFMYVATEGPEGASSLGQFDKSVSNIQKVRLVTDQPSSATSPRAIKALAVTHNEIHLIESSGYSLLSAGLISPDSKTLGGFSLFGKYFIYDGVSSVVYDPRASTPVKRWVSSSLGTVPIHICLGTAWRGRAVVVSSDDPHNWHMSKLADPFNWDEYPEVLTWEQAISGNNPRSIGKFPDIINCLIPFNDEMLGICGDHTIHLLTGDPAIIDLDGTLKSRLSLVSDITGSAFGQDAWAKDPDGVAYFFGSKGGVWRWPPGQMPERISLGSVERRLADYDTSATRIALFWNYREDGLHVLRMPVGTTGVAASSWFWERRTGAWWEDDWAVTGLQPTSAVILDGDQPGDRRLLFGCEDGKVRKWDETASSDSGNRILSRALLGPLAIQGRLRVTHLEIDLAARQSGCEFELYASDNADEMGEIVQSGWLEPGRNALKVRAKGAFLWVRLKSGLTTQRWAFENCQVRIAPAGRRKVGI
jgi:hypothetical protein